MSPPKKLYQNILLFIYSVYSKGITIASDKWKKGGEDMNLLKHLRTECGISQRKLAEEAGMSKPFITWAENGRFIPSPSQLERIALALDYYDEPTDLLKETEK
jgi:DNA-binding XRE family transcriptional regulator